jgi:hypothetical protein
MGQDKAVICRNCEEFVHIDKIPLKGWQDMPADEWFDNEYRQNVAFKIMGFLGDHQSCDIALVGEYGRHQDEFFESSLEWEEVYDIF